MKSYLFLAVGLILSVGTAFSQTKPAADPAVPVPSGKPVIFHACPSWCYPRGHSEQFRFCYDRPFAPGNEPDYVWQLRLMKEAAPNSAMAIYCFVGENRTVEYWSDVFKKYLDAAAETGTKVFPCVHAVDRDVSKRPGDLERLAGELLKKYGDNPNWFQWDGRPFMMDYGSGGITEAGDFTAALRAIRKDNRPVFYVTEALSNNDWAVKGRFVPDYIQGLLQETDGIYHFTQPLDEGLGGYKSLSAEIKKAGPKKIYGAGIEVGYYSARKDNRNFISSRGTLTLRKGFEAALAANPDYLHIKTWNDWVEATSVEPSYKHTYALLDIVSCFARILNKTLFPAAVEPQVIASYRKNIFPGEMLDIEILNLPVNPAFSTLSGKVTLHTAQGKALGEKTFSNLNGTTLSAVVLPFPVPADLGRDMIRVSVEIESVRDGKPFRRQYENLPPVPVVVNSIQADMLEFKIPLHRLHPTAKVSLKMDGEIVGQKNGSAPLPRRLAVDVKGGAPVLGVSYLKDGFIINDPDAASARASVVDNWMSDPTLCGMDDGHDYYGALVAFEDGSIAYSNGAWVEEASANGVWASYQFEVENKYSRYPTGIGDVLRDISGHKFHGVPGAVVSGKKPKWKNLAPQMDILEFDGQGGFVALPAGSNLPGPMTVEMMIRPDEMGREQELLIQRGATISLRLEKDGRVSARRLDENRSLKKAISKEPLAISKWHQISATYNMKTLKLYVDGVLSGEVEVRGLRTSEQIVLGGPIGTKPDSATIDQTVPESYFKGALGSLRILDGPLKEDEIAAKARQALRVFSEF